MSDSVAFDRAAEYYDRTRGLSEAGARHTVDLLAGELRDRGPALEVGVGTGQLALPLREAGVEVVGLDLARPMLDRLIAKAGPVGAPPLVMGDATRAPLRTHGFGAAYLRWVLHLVPAWEIVVGELARIVRPGGTILVSQGSAGGGSHSEVTEHFSRATGVQDARPPGLRWGDFVSLDAAMVGVGARPRVLPTFTETERHGLGAYLEALEENQHSWTWSIPDDVRRRAAAETRRWAIERFGPLDQVPPGTYEIVWRAYDL